MSPPFPKGSIRWKVTESQEPPEAVLADAAQFSVPCPPFATTTLIQYKTGLKEEEGCWGVILSMSEAEKLSREQIEAFLEGSQEHQFRGKHRTEVYAWMKQSIWPRCRYPVEAVTRAAIRWAVTPLDYAYRSYLASG
jgi:hypothetical protein